MIAEDDHAILAPREDIVVPQTGVSKAKAEQFWGDQMESIKSLANTPKEIFKPSIPLARIKKIMKMDENVKMISGEVPHLFAKAAEMFILELTLKSWIHTEESKRRTLQRNDVAFAISQCDMFDFLIDIVPREELVSQKVRQQAENEVEETPEPPSTEPHKEPNQQDLNRILGDLQSSGEAKKLTENGKKSVVVEIGGKRYRLEADK